METTEGENDESSLPMPEIKNKKCQDIIRNNLCSFINRAKEVNRHALLINEKTVNNTIQYALIHAIKLIPQTEELLKKPVIINQELFQPYMDLIINEITNYEPITNNNLLIKKIANELTDKLYKSNLNS